MNIVWISLAGFGGALVAGILGYMKDGGEFDPKKFLPTFLRAVLAGGGIAVAYPLIDMGLGPALVGAFLTGAGLDVTWHRLAGTVKK